eukprot:100245-Amorphochlora_amoeboformis.AAC.1
MYSVAPSVLLERRIFPLSRLFLRKHGKGRAHEIGLREGGLQAPSPRMSQVSILPSSTGFSQYPLLSVFRGDKNCLQIREIGTEICRQSTPITLSAPANTTPTSAPAAGRAQDAQAIAERSPSSPGKGKWS